MQIAAVVTQPGRPRGRGNKAPQPSIVAEKAAALGYAEEQILSPVKASEVRPPFPELATSLHSGSFPSTCHVCLVKSSCHMLYSLEY